jgi:hypothetical protein
LWAAAYFLIKINTVGGLRGECKPPGGGGPRLAHRLGLLAKPWSQAARAYFFSGTFFLPLFSAM